MLIKFVKLSNLNTKTALFNLQTGVPIDVPNFGQPSNTYGGMSREQVNTKSTNFPISEQVL
jgi:hypothetical protein